MSQNIPFVDAHIHLWDLSHIRYPWLQPPFSDDGPNGSVEAIAQDYSLEDYLADACKWDVKGVVHIDSGAHPEDALKETDWLQSIADQASVQMGIVAFAALEDPKVEALLEAHAARENVRGIRQIVNWHRDPNRSYTEWDRTQDSEWQKGFSLLSKYGLSFDLQAYPGQFPALAKTLAKNEQTTAIINHTGMMVGEAGHQEWRDGMKALANLPNTRVKLSGMGFAFRPWSEDQARRYILETIDMFGPDRAMFASDFPTDKLFGSFDQHLDTYSAIVSDFTDQERLALFAGNANRTYKLDLEI